MDYAIGIGLAIVVSGWAALVGFDRDRVFYWWPAFCLAFDVTAASAMLWLLRHRGV